MAAMRSAATPELLLRYQGPVDEALALREAQPPGSVCALLLLRLSAGRPADHAAHVALAKAALDAQGVGYVAIEGCRP
jgi:hypothetical protein